MRIFYFHGKGATEVGRPSHRWGSIGVIEREVSALNLFQTPRPASPKVIFQKAKVLQVLQFENNSSTATPQHGSPMLFFTMRRIRWKNETFSTG